MWVLYHRATHHWLFCDKVTPTQIDYIITDSYANTVKREVLNISARSFVQHKVEVEGWVLENSNEELDNMLKRRGAAKVAKRVYY